jgi:SAM-dependent methyltransferase
MHSQSMEPFGLALMDFFHGDTSAKAVSHRDDGQTEDLPLDVFFREPSAFSALERAAIDCCRGHVLDVGAGAGCHSLVLQARGLPVCAIDISPQAVEIMLKRGVQEVQCADIFTFRGGPFDTILMMMHGIGITGTLSGLDRFLDHAHRLLKPDGQILFDSLDVRYTENPLHLAYQRANRQAGRYFGEFRLQFEYRGKKGSPFSWLNVDPETLTEHAARANWSCEIIRQEENGDYLARLTALQK